MSVARTEKSIVFGVSEEGNGSAFSAPALALSPSLRTYLQLPSPLEGRVKTPMGANRKSVILCFFCTAEKKSQLPTPTKNLPSLSLSNRQDT